MGIDIAVISSWYYLRSLAGRYWYKVGITSSPYWASKAGIALGRTCLVGSLIPGTVPVYISGF
jgi:hypothetical protein